MEREQVAVADLDDREVLEIATQGVAPPSLVMDNLVRLFFSFDIAQKGIQLGDVALNRSSIDLADLGELGE